MNLKMETGISAMKTLVKLPLLVPNQEYARMLGVSARTLYNYDKAGILSPPKVINGRKFRDPMELPKFDGKKFTEL